MKLKVKVQEQYFNVEIGDLRSRPILATVDGETFEVWPETQTAQSVPADDAQAGHSETVGKPKLTSSTPISAKTTDPTSVRAPIPGVITAVLVEPGCEVFYGQELCKLEAMKMNNSIRASQSGTIASVHISIGQQVKHHDLLIEFAKN